MGSVSGELDTERALRSLEGAASRVASLLREVRDPSVTAIGHWSVADLAAHLRGQSDNYVGMVRGETHPAGSTENLTAYNEEVVRGDPDPDPAAVAAHVERRTADLATAVRAAGDGDPDVTWMPGIVVPRTTIIAIALGEYLVHGYDLARALGHPWEISSEDGSVLVLGLAPFMPYYVDPIAASGFTATFDLRVRHGARSYLVFEDGSLIVEAPSNRPVDCHISGDPSTFIPVMYGRGNPIKAALTGKVIAWGRKPWLGLKLPTLIKSP